MSTREEWAEDHGYWHWTCRECGMSGWTDTRPECACTLYDEETDEDELFDPMEKEEDPEEGQCYSL